jgi:sugar transferase (PEP-CTERM/EpsH1 system associated)
MRILYVTPYVPSRIRTRPYHLIRALLQLGHQITLLTATGMGPEEREQIAELEAWGVHVEPFTVPLRRSLANCLQVLPTREPLQAAYAYHPAMERRLVELLDVEGFDVVHVEHLRAARLVRAVGRVPLVYDAVDCISLLFEQAAAMGAGLRSRLVTALDLPRTRRYEAHLLARVDRVVITSGRDKDALDALGRRFLPPGSRRAPVTVVSNGVDLAYFCPPTASRPRRGRDVVFTGKMSYHANATAVLYFVREILPLIRAAEPDVQLWVVGKDPPKSIRELAVDGRIQVTGTVDDLRPYLARAAVAVCPVRYAVGIQNKVLEAMAMGTPVVCTPAAFSGLAARQEDEILVGETPVHFASQVLALLSDPGRAARLAQAGRRYVEAHHDWQGAARRLVASYQAAGREPIRRAASAAATPASHPR